MIALLQEGICKKYFAGSDTHIIISMIAVALAGYLLGSLNFDVIISKILRKDNKNQDVAAALPEREKKAAGLALTGDFLKTAAAIFIGALLLGDHVMGFAVPGTYLGGLASLAGHAFPVYRKFKNRNCIIIPAATMILCTDWLVFIIILAIFLCVALWTKYLSLASIMGALIYPLILYRMTRFPGFHVIAAIFVMLLILFLNRSNMHRLWNGTETKLKLNLNPKIKK